VNRDQEPDRPQNKRRLISLDTWVTHRIAQEYEKCQDIELVKYRVHRELAVALSNLWREMQ